MVGRVNERSEGIEMVEERSTCQTKRKLYGRGKWADQRREVAACRGAENSKHPISKLNILTLLPS
jgi:hypothetical protein